MGAWLNPYRSPEAFRVIKWGGVVYPPYLVAIDGVEVSEEWNVQKGTGTTGATTVWRGTKVVEGVVITLEAPDEKTFDGFEPLVEALKAPKGKKPPTILVENGLLNNMGLDRVSLSKRKLYSTGKSLSWRMDIGLIQYFPSKVAPTGPQDPAKKPGDPEPKDAAEAEVKKLLDKAMKV